jgi:hypothetical protein
MKNLYCKANLVIASLVALLGVSSANAKSLTTDVSAKSPLYLEHGSNLNGHGGIVVCDHESHYSHESHASHVSHSSGY